MAPAELAFPADENNFCDFHRLEHEFGDRIPRSYFHQLENEFRDRIPEAIFTGWNEFGDRIPRSYFHQLENEFREKLFSQAAKRFWGPFIKLLIKNFCCSLQTSHKAPYKALY